LPGIAGVAAPRGWARLPAPEAATGAAWGKLGGFFPAWMQQKMTQKKIDQIEK